MTVKELKKILDNFKDDMTIKAVCPTSICDCDICLADIRIGFDIDTSNPYLCIDNGYYED